MKIFNYFVGGRKQKAFQTLREEISSIKSRSLEGKTGADLEWSKYLLELRDSILTADIGNFISWPVIRSTMFYKGVPKELAYLRGRKDWPIWEEALRESDVGKPPRFPQMKSSSGNLIHHAYSLAQFFPNIRAIKDVKSIFEFGGGYGSLVRLVHKLGFKGEYVVMDFPEFLALQKYYLSALGIEGNFRFISELESLKPELFIGLWSISETPLGFREPLLLEIEAQNYLIAYQNKFNEVDNVKYFQGLKDKRLGLSWANYNVPAFDNDLSRYLIGKRQGN
jgi:hypothetical protein